MAPLVFHVIYKHHHYQRSQHHHTFSSSHDKLRYEHCLLSRYTALLSPTQLYHLMNKSAGVHTYPLITASSKINPLFYHLFILATATAAAQCMF